jgi:iron(III) transport system substrate-binding protein
VGSTKLRDIANIDRRVLLRALLAAPLALSARAAFAADAKNEDWKADWDRTLDSARKEGQLIVSGPVGRLWSDFLVPRFNKEFPGITLKMTPFAARDFWVRVIKEREVGQYLWDLRLGGTDSALFTLMRQGAITPTRPLLVLPENTDDDNWWGGIDGLFADSAKTTLLAFGFQTSQTSFYNKDVIPQDLSAEDLIKPEWTGKISLDDPRGGSVFNQLAVLLKVYGEDYVRTLLLKQKVVIPGSKRQQVEWMVSGRYPIGFGVVAEDIIEVGQRGARVDMIVPIKTPAQTFSQGFGGISLIDKAPHPNAAKVFINWILTRDIQTDLDQAVKINSRRKGVLPGAPHNAIDTSRLDQYFGHQTEDFNPYHERVAAIVREMPR